MDVTHHLDHVQVLNHIAHVIRVHQTATQATSNLPKSAATTHYGPDGRQVASTSTTSYAGVKMSQGKIVGGQLRHTSMAETGKPLSSSEVSFQQDGTPGTIQTATHNRFSDGLYKHISTDMTDVSWNAASNVVSGNIHISSVHADNRSLRTTGSLTYDNEVPTSGQFTHYVKQGGRATSGFTHVDYTQTNFRGSRMTGGYCTVRSKDAKGLTKAHSNVFMSSQGMVQEIHTTNFDPESGAITNKVFSDFANLEFTPRKEFNAGTVTYNVVDDKGIAIAKTTALFAEARPAHTETQQIKNGEITHKIVTDYRDATFNNDLAPINCTVTTKVTSVEGKLVSQSSTEYDAEGNPAKKTTEVYSSKTGALFSTVTSDYANVIFSHSHKPIGGTLEITTVMADGSKTIHSEKDFGDGLSSISTSEELVTPSTKEPAKDITKITTVKDAQGQVTSRRKTITRSNGTLLKTVITHVSHNQPTSSDITLYGTDGTKVLKTYSLDLSQIAYNNRNGQVSGSVCLQSKFAGAVLDSESTLTYS